MARKQAWVDDLALKAGQAGSDQILAEAGQSAETMSRDLSVVASMSVASEDPTKMVGELLGGMNLGAGISALTKRNSGIASIGSDLRKGVAGGGSASAMSLVARFQDSQNEELGTRAALIVADQARTSLAKAKKGYEQTVASANESFSSQMDSLFLGSAFVKTGSNYVRDAIVDATTAGALKEEQSVAVYKPFTSFSFEVATSLSQNDLQGLGAEGVQAQVARAMGELEAKQEEIFGAASAQNIVTTLLINGSDGKYTDSTSSTTGTRTTTVSQTRKGGPDGDPTETLVEKTETYQILTERTETQEQSPGLFGAHIGYAPIFQKNPSAEDLSKPEDMVVASGSGELGRLMMYYSYYEIKEGAGLEEYGKPSWERKMWDDRGSWLDAPSPKDVINLGVSIAASSLAPWAVMAVNLADDALFGAMDVGIGYKEADEALVDFGKTALSSALTTGLSAYGSTIMGSMGGVASATTGVVSKASGLYTIGGIDGVIARAAFTGAQSFASNVASSAVNSITYSHDAGFGYNSDSFQESVFGTSALVSYASGMASSFVSGTMGLGNLTAADGHALNSQFFQTGQIASLNNLAGSLVGAGISYGMTNELTLNVLNATDLLGSKFSGGMLEMHLGGDDGFSMGLGSDGTNVSASQLLAAAAGFEESKRILEWKNSTAADQKTFNAINGLGYTSNGSNWEIGRRIFTGALGVDYSSTLDGSILGQYDENKPGRITLNDDLLALDSDLGTAELASVLAHEGSHYLGNNVEGIAHLAGGQAFSELSEAWGVKDAAFSGSIASAIYDPESWKRNTGDVQNWLLKKDGTVVDDGSADWHWEAVIVGIDKDGKPIYKTIINANGMTKEDSLALMSTPMKQRFNNSWASWDTNKSNKYVKLFGDAAIQEKYDIGFGAGKGDDLAFAYYDSLYDLYMQNAQVKAAGSPAKWIAENMRTVTFFKQQVDVNQETAKGLALAEADYKSTGETWVPSLDGGGGFWPRTVRNDPTKLSDHALGYAVDLNPSTNPLVYLTVDGKPNDVAKLLSYISGKDVTKLTDYAMLEDMSKKFLAADKDQGALISRLGKDLVSSQAEFKKLKKETFGMYDPKTVGDLITREQPIIDRINLLKDLKNLAKQNIMSTFWTKDQYQKVFFSIIYYLNGKVL